MYVCLHVKDTINYMCKVTSNGYKGVLLTVAKSHHVLIIMIVSIKCSVYSKTDQYMYV